MANDIERIAGSKAAVAARFCNFPTGHADLLPSHKQWLDQNVKKFMGDSPNPWVDLFGYASHLGNAAYNKQLSNRRCEAVMAYVRQYNPKASFPQEFGFGDSKSTGGRTDNDGRWRAVEIYVYGAPPPGVRPRPPIPLPVPKDWFVTGLSLSSISAVVALGFTAATGTITFAKANGESYTCPIGLFGPSVGLSYVPNFGKLLAKIPGFGSFLSRFPVLKRILMPAEELTSAQVLKFLDAMHLPVIHFFWSNPRLLKAIQKVMGGLSGGAENWWSGAIGEVWGSRGRELQKVDFSGPCVCYSVGGTVGPGNFGIYALFFGLDRGFSSLVLSDPMLLVDLNRLEGHAKGFAIISAASASAAIPGLGAGATIFVGEIV